MNSPSGTTTSVPAGRLAAIRPTPTDTVGISAISAAVAPINSAKSARQTSPARSHSLTQSAVPSCQRRSARSSASTVGFGGNPYVAASR